MSKIQFAPRINSRELENARAAAQQADLSLAQFIVSAEQRLHCSEEFGFRPGETYLVGTEGSPLPLPDYSDKATSVDADDMVHTHLGPAAHERIIEHARAKNMTASAHIREALRLNCFITMNTDYPPSFIHEDERYVFL